MVFLHAILFSSLFRSAWCVRFFSSLLGCCSLLSARTHQVTWDQLVDCINKIKGKHVLFIRICHVHCTTLAFIRPTNNRKSPSTHKQHLKHRKRQIKQYRFCMSIGSELSEYGGWEQCLCDGGEVKYRSSRESFCRGKPTHYDHAHYIEKSTSSVSFSYFKFLFL